jgi:hypothetical protein
VVKAGKKCSTGRIVRRTSTAGSRDSLSSTARIQHLLLHLHPESAEAGEGTCGSLSPASHFFFQRQQQEAGIQERQKVPRRRRQVEWYRYMSQPSGIAYLFQEQPYTQGSRIYNMKSVVQKYYIT